MQQSIYVWNLEWIHQLNMQLGSVFALFSDDWWIRKVRPLLTVTVFDITFTVTISDQSQGPKWNISAEDEPIKPVGES